MINIIPDDRKDDITYLEEMLQEVAKCIANKVYADWKRTNRLISRDIAMIVTPVDIVNYFKTILKFKQEKGVHPTQKPVPLMEYLIKTYTNEGDTILDPTMGSGTTGVACVNTNRNFIGIERNENYFGIAQKRIDDAVGLMKFAVSSCGKNSP